MIAGRKEVSKFIDWAADIKFADFSVWGHAQTCAAFDGDGQGGNMESLYLCLLLVWQLNRQIKEISKPNRNANHESAVPPTYRCDCGLLYHIGRLSAAAAFLFPRRSGAYPL
jgi:hypothetical protein